MKFISFTGTSMILFALIMSCNQQPATDHLQAQIDSLNNTISRLKPGLGEFMLQIKYHHDELGRAITARDYDRAAYEVDEMKETTDKIKSLHITNDKLQKPFIVFFEKYLESPLNILAQAAAGKDNAALRTNFTGLTNNCNACHHENNMAFMKIEDK
jgi:hypothetical protein